MKMLAMLSAVALAAAFFPMKAAASGSPLILNASGTIVLQGSQTNHTSTATNINVTTTLSFNQKYIYNLISNAVASTNYPYLIRTNLPADGYIAFDPTNLDLNRLLPNGDFYTEGLFYVTNKDGFYYPLNGFDGQTNFYSYIELNDDDFCFYETFYGAFKGSESPNTQTGTFNETETAELFVHDDPYYYDDGDNPEQAFNSVNAIEIRSPLNATFVLEGSVFQGPPKVISNSKDVTSGSGTGSITIGENSSGTVTSGHFSLLP